MASSRMSATTTPLPAARPSALTTTGMASPSTYSHASPNELKARAADVGTPDSSISLFANSLLLSMRAASLRGTEYGLARVLEPVDDAGRQRGLRADDGQVDRPLTSHLQKSVEVLRVNFHVGRYLGRPGVPRRDKQLVYEGALGTASRRWRARGRRLRPPASSQAAYSHSMVPGGLLVTS